MMVTGPDATHARTGAAAPALRWPVAPMLATAAGAMPGDEGWACECKWDGMRVLALIDQHHLSLVSRTGRDVTAQFPELGELLDAPGPRPLILDGEVVALAAGRPSFAELQPRMYASTAAGVSRLARRHPAVYLVFDVMHLGRQPLWHEAWHRRRLRLEALGLASAHVSVPPASHDLAAMQAAARSLGLEGVVAKRLDSTYRPGIRSPHWLKLRFVLAQEFVVAGYRALRSGHAITRELGSLALGYHARPGDDRLTFAGLVGSGLTRANRRDLLRALLPRRQETNPFAGQPQPPSDVRFVHPELVVHVAFIEWTPQGLLRQPAFKGLRLDKPVGEVVRET